MEEKIKRESKQYIEKMFKKHDTLNCGAVTKASMKQIVDTLLTPTPYDEEELETLMLNHVKEAKYTVHNKKTNQFEVKYLPDSIDFPSAMAISVRFLLKGEKANNPFSGTGLVKLAHFEANTAEQNRKNSIKKHDIAAQKRRIF